MSEGDGLRLSWGARERLKFIEFRLFWNARVNRADLVATFGISTQQASGDLADYKKIAPKNLEYDNLQKAYIRAPEFEPIFITENINRYMIQIAALSAGWIRADETWFSEPPHAEVVSLERPSTNAKIVMVLNDAINRRELVEIRYQSLTGGNDAWQWIAPHAMAYCAGRWYLRAWSKKHNDFRDYNLYRLQEVRSVEKSNVDANYDYEWVHKIDLVIAANEKLDDARRRAVENEYGMKNGELRVTTRLSVSFYLMSEHNLDVPMGVLRPEKQQLVLKNLSEVERARQVARNLSVDALRRATME